ncbi:CoA-binding protein [Haloglomus salinum]|jgi:predicted CoA-binding protein|uniref:CoA-binding protein n=1 Tax=Haloglomus salinum TaxID=2962673 RepID=UPI0020C95971|nr:CoA-binding protein [Haloglomus salinum]
MPITDADGLRRVLGHDRVAVVGASTDYDKAAHIVPAYLQRHGYELTPVNPTADEIFGEPAFDSLADVPDPVDIVEVFRPSEEVPGIIEQALARDDVRAVWLQPGITHDAAARDAEAAGLDVVQDRCMKVEHGQLIRNPMD